MASHGPFVSSSQAASGGSVIAFGTAIAALLRATSRTELQNLLPVSAAALFGAERGLLLRRMGKKLLVTAAGDSKWLGRELAMDEDVCAIAFKTRKPVLWQQSDGPALRLDGDFSSALALPLTLEGQALALSLYRREAFGLADLAIAKALCDAVTPLWGHLGGEEARQLQLEAQAAELRQQAFTVSQLQEQVAQGDRLKAAFVATISHELRTPLNVVLGFGSLLADEAFGPLNAEQSDACGKIIESTERLAGLINDLLDFSSLQACILELHFSRVDLRSLLETAIEDIQPLAERKRQSIELTLEPALPEITADPDRLWQALKHLLDNAVKFTPEGGRIGVRVKLIERQAAIAIEVWDTGIGIPSEAMHRLFERFYQVDSSNTRLYGGTGIGLALVKELVERHGGTVSVESSVGAGSVFRLLLPLSPHDQVCEPSYRD